MHGVSHGVDGDPDDESLLSGLQSAVWVLSATREGRTLTLRFEGPVPSDQVTLHRVRFPVPPARPRPLECRQCGRYGHVKETCNWPGSCIRCGQTHPEETDCQRLRCVNCSGPHRTDTPDCPRWQEQRRVATIMASSTTALSRRAVAALVREETREARSYSSAVKGHPAPVAPTPAPRTRRQPPPAATAHIPAVPGSRAAPVIQPAATVPPRAVGAPGVQPATTPASAPTVEHFWAPYCSLCRRSLLCYQQTTRFAPSVCRQGHGNRPPTIMASPPTRPHIQHLALRAARRRAERQALSKAQRELWTLFRRVDAVCRRHARRRRNQGWAVDLAGQLADQFAARDIAQLPAAPPPAALQCPGSCHHPGWIAVQIEKLAKKFSKTVENKEKPKPWRGPDLRVTEEKGARS
ncbi:hypothetical protein HPB52_000807 [Rhipicephalus sanguineus]|uniref:CCHC-type domain-containing protein n=1 Tax=Rhipicephalus sanguineus TaxID=34632 RepID=A0A9D4SX43_RHISA|nr:hypothetical protein HPB52_000807 [Rhipicephalus sanguineus]